MYGRWSRYGDFSKSAFLQYVSYIADREHSVITRIDLCIIQSGSSDRVNERPKGSAFITFSSVYRSTINNLCKELQIETRLAERSHLQHQGEYEGWLNLQGTDCTATFAIESEEFLKLLEFMRQYNSREDVDESKPKPFPPELINELLAIYKTETTLDITHFQHRIEARQEFELPKNRTYDDVSKLWMFATRPFCDDHVKYLSEHCDSLAPRQEFLRLAITDAVVKQPISALKWLLWFKADPFTRGKDWRISGISGKDNFCGDSSSAYELAVRFGQAEKAELIKIEKSKPGLNVVGSFIKTESGYMNDSVISCFHFETLKKTKLMLVTSLSDEERSAIRQLFKDTFKSLKDTSEFHENQKDLMNEFDLEFSSKPPHRLIDIIYSQQNEIIRFVLLEIILPKPTEFKRNISLYCAYSAIKQEYRDTGLMQLLIFRVAHALKCLNPASTVAVFYLAVHYKGYRIANDYHHWPKHQDQEAGTLAEHLLDLVIPVEYHYVHDYLTTYVDLDIVVKSTPSTQPTYPSRLDEQMFEEELLGFKLIQPAPNKRRTVPVLFTISPDTRARAESHAKTLKIDFQKHIREFADPLGALLRKHEVKIVESGANNLPFFRPTKQLRDLKECINLTKPKL